MDTIQRKTIVAVVAGALALGAAAPAAANRVEFAAGEQFVEPQAADFSRTGERYWTDHRDLSAYTPGTWRTLKRRRATLTVHLRYMRDFGPVPAGMPRHDDVWPIIRGARRHDVPIIAWLVVPYTDGYWAHEANVAQTRAAVQAYYGWAKRKGVEAKAILLDLESSIGDTRTLTQLRTNPGAVISMFRRNADPAAQCATSRAYQDLVDDIHAHGYRAAAAAHPFVLDDLLNGDMALSDGLNLPLFRPGQFDEIGFMTMRGVYVGFTGEDPGPSLQASYAQTLDRYYPGAMLVLGVLGEGPLSTLDATVADARAVATVSSEPIGSYSLETTFKAFGVAGVRAVLRAAGSPYSGADVERISAPSNGTSASRSLLSVLDGMVGVGTPLAGPSTGAASQTPTAWPPPPTCID